MIELIRISKSDSQLQEWMEAHYSRPKGFVGRQLIYQIQVGGVLYGAIAAGSATRFLPGRDAFFGAKIHLNNLVNNTFFHVFKQNGKYPFRNFTTKVVAAWRERVLIDWSLEYSNRVLGWETLVELPRTGLLYLKDGWVEIGVTKGYTCKRVAGKGTDSWSGKRVWDTKNLRPKRVFARKVE